MGGPTTHAVTTQGPTGDQNCAQGLSLLSRHCYRLLWYVGSCILCVANCESELLASCLCIMYHVLRMCHMSYISLVHKVNGDVVTHVEE